MAAIVEEDRRRYRPLENVLNAINKDFIQLSKTEVIRNNAILRELLSLLTGKMQKVDNLFKEMFSTVFYGGSFYDGLRVGTPDEFDLDLLLTLPKLVEPELILCNIPGYLQLKLNNYPALQKDKSMANRYKDLRKLLEDEKDYYLDNQKVRQWMERVVTLALNDFQKENGKYVLDVSMGRFLAKIHKAGPAFTLKVTGQVKGEKISLDIDLVPCFLFGKDKWPKSQFRPNPVASKVKPKYVTYCESQPPKRYYPKKRSNIYYYKKLKKTDFFIVPKPVKDAPGRSNRYWRLSFQQQERIIIDNKNYLKPTIKFLKKMRDVSDHTCIASYYIKTLVLWETEKMCDAFWSSSISYVFMTILKKYYECLRDKRIPYYWYKTNNLIQGVNDITMQNMQNRIKYIINDIESHLQDDPSVVIKYLLTPMEQTQYRTSTLSLR
ncbi:unnamed protein product [Psylliodes chrysocephalus]|uniref:Uncharacterized protein n=1 Tax=Psylliodes chrysocephalus TaxID=3402493 RepID=A0A9P0CYD4_9CUCU|nr:unnamed protein product [Psylliodes chrysocephala]